MWKLTTTCWITAIVTNIALNYKLSKGLRQFQVRRSIF